MADFPQDNSYQPVFDFTPLSAVPGGERPVVYRVNLTSSNSFQGLAAGECVGFVIYIPDRGYHYIPPGQQVFETREFAAVMLPLDQLKLQHLKAQKAHDHDRKDSN